MVIAKLKDELFLRRITSTIIGGEALLLFFLGLFLIIESFIAQVKNVDALIAEIVFALLGGIGLLVAAKGIRRGKRYGNSPAMLANLIALAVSYYIWQGGWLGISLMLGSFAVLAIIGILFITAQSAQLKED